MSNSRTTGWRAPIAAALAIALACAGGLAGCSSDSTAGSDGGSSSSESAASTVTTTVNEGETVTCTSEYAGADADTINEWQESTLYDVDAQAAIAEELESQKDGQTLAAPLVAYNPFGTNSQALYVYFTTDETATVSYTVSVSDEEVATIEDESLTSTSIADFTRDVDDGESATEFEFLVMGLIPNVENTVSITATYEDGSTETTTFACEMCDVLGSEELQLSITEGESDAELTDGLYAVLSNSSAEVNFVYLYDNDGILRGEIPSINGRSYRLVFEDDLMYLGITNYKLAAMNELGQVVRIYTLNEDANYNQHHDYTTDGEDHLIVLGTDGDSETVEDLVLFVDKETGEVDSVLDMGDLLPDYKEAALEYYYANAEEDESGNFLGEEGVDWIHLNAVAWVGDDSIIVSAREVSSIIKISDVYGTPTIDYILGSSEFWDGTGYEDLVYEQVGDFQIQGGQHGVMYGGTDGLEDGQSYVYFFNNNIGTSSTSDFDFSSIGLTNTTATSDEEGVYSYYYKYLVDENEGTFELVESIAVPYAGFISSVQDIGSNEVIDAGGLSTFGEYDEDGVLIRLFSMDIDLIYRVYKYDL